MKSFILVLLSLTLFSGCMIESKSIITPKSETLTATQQLETNLATQEEAIEDKYGVAVCGITIEANSCRSIFPSLNQLQYQEQKNLLGELKTLKSKYEDLSKQKSDVLEKNVLNIFAGETQKLINYYSNFSLYF